MATNELKAKDVLKWIWVLKHFYRPIKQINSGADLYRQERKPDAWLIDSPMGLVPAANSYLEKES